MVEEEKGAAGGEAARNSERNRTHENQLKLSLTSITHENT